MKAYYISIEDYNENIVNLFAQTAADRNGAIRKAIEADSKGNKEAAKAYRHAANIAACMMEELAKLAFI